MEEKKLGVALVHLACPVCGVPVEEEIVMNTKLTTHLAKRVENMNDKIIGHADKVCDTCKKEMEQGIKIVEVDSEASEETIIPVRTGRYVVITEEAVDKIFKEGELKDNILKNRYGFADQESFEALFGDIFNDEDDKKEEKSC